MASRPLVLCTNDDGIVSPHLDALADLIEDFADVLVVAPERQRSAASHAITLHKPLRLTEVAPRRYSLSGTPVDCVYLGVLSSAIAAGGRRVGASTMATTSAATSSTRGPSRRRSKARCAARPASRARSRRARPTSLDAVRLRGEGRARGDREPIPAGTVLNVNMPGTGSEQYQWTTLGRRLYEDDVAERKDPRGRPVLLGRRRTRRSRGRRRHRLRRDRARLEQHHADAPRSDRSRAAREATVGDRRLSRDGRPG